MALSVKCEEFLPWFLEAELKHARICMMAWGGLVVPEIFRIPGPEACYTASGADAHNACQDSGIGNPRAQTFAFCGLIEMTTSFPKMVQGLTLGNAGDHKLGLNFLPTGSAKVKEMKLKELKRPSSDDGQRRRSYAGGAPRQRLPVALRGPQPELQGTWAGPQRQAWKGRDVRGGRLQDEQGSAPPAGLSHARGLRR
jgi:hypothetical protein